MKTQLFHTLKGPGSRRARFRLFSAHIVKQFDKRLRKIAKMLQEISRTVGERRSVTHTPKYDFSIVPSCQTSARNGEYGVPESISGAATLAYSPVRIPVVGKPVTTRDDGSESGSKITASSKSLM
jgi:hypothetical protein